MRQTTSGDNLNPAVAERRATPRLQLVAPLQGHDDRGDDVTLVNISQGGLLVHSTQPASAGEMRQFRFDVGEGGVTTFSARVVHVLRISGSQGASYAIGLEFADAVPEGLRRAMARIATVKGDAS
jgi:c-di-GMP-binding flagellar brake protein YcgR